MVSAQFSLQLGQHFLPGEKVKKIHITPEDFTVWVLTKDSKVFYKDVNSPNFQPYNLVNGYQVTDLAGYDRNDIYFLIGDLRLLHVKNNVRAELNVNLTGVTKINGLSITSPAYRHSNINYEMKDGWLGIATNKDLYYQRRNQSMIIDYPYINFQQKIAADWHHYHSGFKGASYQYDFLYQRACINPLESSSYNYHFYNSTVYASGYPDKAPFPKKTTASMMSYHYANNGSHYIPGTPYEFRGTENGVYLKHFHNCTYPEVKHFLNNSIINDLDEVYALSGIYRQNFILAATNKGLAFTPGSIFPGHPIPVSTNNFNAITFVSSNVLPVINVTDVEVDSRPIPSDNGEYSESISLCDQVIWAGTDDGIFQLYAKLDQDFYKESTGLSYIYYGSIPSDYDHPQVIIYGDEPADIGVAVPYNNALHNKISWFKDGIEMPELVNKIKVSLAEPGTYMAKVTALCEGITINSLDLVIIKNPDPEITFDYPDRISICENESIVLSTVNKAEYTYQWFKDGLPINGAISNSYRVVSEGSYRVDVSNRPGVYKSSKVVKADIAAFDIPMVTADKASYCEGTEARLSFPAVAGLTSVWLFDGSEIAGSANQTEIPAVLSGLYSVRFTNSAACTKATVPYNLNFRPLLPAFEILKDVSGNLCTGQQVTLNPSAEGSRYVWSTGAGSRSIRITESGTYSVTIENSSGCSSSAFIEIVMKDLPVLSPIADTVICTMSGEKLLLSAKPGFAFYSWNGVRAGSSTYTVSSPGTYELVVEDEYGCKSSTSFVVSAWCRELIIPNTFTPNGDGVNDTWQIGGLNDDAEVNIYNRYGSLIFKSSGAFTNWDGKTKGEDVAVGTYYYTIKTSDGRPALKGSITVIR